MERAGTARTLHGGDVTDLETALLPRLLLFTGGGGSRVSTLAAANALLAAKRGRSGALSSAEAGKVSPPRRVLPWTLYGPVAAGGLLDADLPPDRLPAPVRRPRFQLMNDGVDLVLPVPLRPPAEWTVRRLDQRVEVRAARWRRAFTVPEQSARLPGRRAWHDGLAFRVRFAPWAAAAPCVREHDLSHAATLGRSRAPLPCP